MGRHRVGVDLCPARYELPTWIPGHHAGVIVTARLEGRLVGVSRAVTDFCYCTYLSDLAVDRQYQRQGIGRELIRQTHEAAGLNTTLILLAAPLARTYYPHIGMHSHDSCWIIPRSTSLTVCFPADNKST